MKSYLLGLMHQHCWIVTEPVTDETVQCGRCGGTDKVWFQFELSDDQVQAMTQRRADLRKMSDVQFRRFE